MRSGSRCGSGPCLSKKLTLSFLAASLAGCHRMRFSSSFQGGECIGGVTFSFAGRLSLRSWAELKLSEPDVGLCVVVFRDALAKLLEPVVKLDG